MRARAHVVAAVLLAVARPAVAGPTVSLNGVSIDGVANQRFENATVVIDGQGNVDIQARGYAARASAPGALAGPVGAPPRLAGAEPAPAAPARLARRYFLATEQSELDGTQYDVEVFIDSSWVRVLRSADGPTVMEVTRYLHPGRNQITLASTKRLVGVARRSTRADVTLRIVIGAGSAGDGRVTIDAPLVVVTRSAAEVDDKVEEFTVDAR